MSKGRRKGDEILSDMSSSVLNDHDQRFLEYRALGIHISQAVSCEYHRELGRPPCTVFMGMAPV